MIEYSSSPLRNKHRQAAAYESWLAGVRGLFADRLMPVRVDAAQEWGHRDAERPGSMADGLIAATAKVRGLDRGHPQRRGFQCHRRTAAEPVYRLTRRHITGGRRRKVYRPVWQTPRICVHTMGQEEHDE